LASIDLTNDARLPAIGPNETGEVARRPAKGE
jgi:hypothetical protein